MDCLKLTNKDGMFKRTIEYIFVRKHKVYSIKGNLSISGMELLFSISCMSLCFRSALEKPTNTSFRMFASEYAQAELIYLHSCGTYHKSTRDLGG